jgi:methylglutaconyl-CoA hydratase
MASQEVTLYEVKDGAAWITLNRPERRNAISAELVAEAYDHLAAAVDDDRVRAIVITGAGKGFCAGADLKNPPGSALGGGRTVTYPELLTAIWECEKPVIAMVNGAAFAGGLGLVGAADIVITAEDAQFSFSEVRIGVIPAIISVVCLRKMAPQHGSRLFITGARFDGPQAVEYGLAHRAVPLAELAAAVREELDMIQLGGPIAVAECKKLARLVPTWTLEEGFQNTESWSRRMFQSDEASQGMAAFRDKRKPPWVEADGQGSQGGEGKVPS